MGVDIIFPTTKGVLKKLGGDKISGKVYTFSGDTTGRETGYYNGIQFVMLADEYFDPNTIERIAVSVSGSVVELSKTQFWIQNETDEYATAHVVLTEFQGATVPIALIQKSNDGSQKSFGVLADPNYNAFVARLNFAETIVPIDQKYLHKEINLADYGIDLLAVANSGQNQVTFEAPGLRDAIGDGTNVIFVNPSEDLTLMARPTLIMRGDGFVRFQISIDFADDNSKTVTKIVFILGFGDAFADTLIIDLFT